MSNSPLQVEFVEQYSFHQFKMEWIWFEAVKKNMNRKYHIDKATTTTIKRARSSELCSDKQIENESENKDDGEGEQKKRTWERNENANNVWVCEFECVFSGIENFGMKFKSKCHGEGANVWTSEQAKREEKLLSENKTEIPLSF